MPSRRGIDCRVILKCVVEWNSGTHDRGSIYLDYRPGSGRMIEVGGVDKREVDKVACGCAYRSLVPKSIPRGRKRSGVVGSAYCRGGRSGAVVQRLRNEMFSSGLVDFAVFQCVPRAEHGVVVHGAAAEVRPGATRQGNRIPGILYAAGSIRQNGILGQHRCSVRCKSDGLGRLRIR